MRNSAAFLISAIASLAMLSSLSAAEDVPAALPTLKVPEGFTIELAAGPPIVGRPIVAAFDDLGRLYVAESSGSNDPVQKQLAEKPHRIVRLEDTDGDGKFDRRTVFADHMMFPEGAMYFDDSLYVSAPPSIWKLTDKDGDGVADERIEWFQGKTLTGCANDLHGPYAGPDGWIYWCKGAFAEQTHEVNGKPWTTKASHIFRCKPDGSGFEPVFTSGMDNPVDVAFTADGERILSGTFFTGNPRHDGLAHAIYGGVYGKENSVIAGHPRTGGLMPVFDQMSAAACCGLDRYDSDVFGASYRDNFFLCQFNLRKVSRHVLSPAGSTFTSQDSDFVSSDFVDFHPTDVVVDADGSLLVIDTGGWYKLCCPTSQLWKPDVLGGIYRVRRVGAKPPDDPRGTQIKWREQSLEQLWDDLGDSRPEIRRRATHEFATRRSTATMKHFILSFDDLGPAEAVSDAILRTSSTATFDKRTAAQSRTWALAQVDSEESRSFIRGLQGHKDEQVRHIALNSIGLHRDKSALPWLFEAIENDTPANQRVAAEALGRIGNQSAVPQLLAAAAHANDRIGQHSIIYSLIELADPAATRAGLAADDPQTVAAALIALDQMPDGAIKPSNVIPHLNSSDSTLQQAARWIVSQHSDWGGELAQWFTERLNSLPEKLPESTDNSSSDSLANMFAPFVADPTIEQLLADTATAPASKSAAREFALRVISNSNVEKPPTSWVGAIAATIAAADKSNLTLGITAARRFSSAMANDPKATDALTAIANGEQYSPALRVDAISVLIEKHPQLSEAPFSLLIKSLSADTPVAVRSAAADSLSKSHLTPTQLDQLCVVIKSAGPLELNRLLKPFDQSSDGSIGLRLIAALKQSPSIASLRLNLLREALATYGPDVERGVIELEGLVNADAATQRKRIEELLPAVAKGDVRRGHAVFYSAKASCSSCHRLGYAGGTIGPELTHVGKTRTERDILESILFPSLSFVRSYEPMLITTKDGKTINGVIRDETGQEYLVATGPDQFAHIPRQEIEDISPSAVSIMPAGLDKQLTTQEIADLVVFLKSTAEH